MLVKTYNDIVNSLSFATNLRKLRSRINQSIDVPEIINEFPHSHPRGFIKEFKKRRTTIVETYLKITKSLESTDYNERIHALSLLADNILYARTLKMPLNAARVQLALMKEVVKNRDNKRVQLELMRDFTVSSFGHQRVLRRLLKKLDIIEVPETGEELRDLKMGWDFHVHDSTSYGRKLPTQLIIDAFIKGISELTIVYSNLDREESIKEVLEAGRILGIKVNIALEFSALSSGLRFHYLYILPNFLSKKSKFKKFLKQKTDDLRLFLNELEENEKKREKNIELLIDNFNTAYLPDINKGYDAGSIYYLDPLKLNGAETVFGHKIYSRRQLGEFLYPKLKNVIEKRALRITALKNQAETAPEEFTNDEIDSINQQFEQLRKQYRDLEPEKIRLKYFAGNEMLYAETAVSSLEDIYELARKSGGTIKFIQPLEHGLQAAVDKILDNYNILTYTEIYNIYGTIESMEADFVTFTNFIRHLNHNSYEHTCTFLESSGLNYDPEKLLNAREFLSHHHLIPAIGSDAAGRSTLAPGMGFVLKSRLARHQRNYFLRNHYTLPDEVSALIYSLAKIPKTPLKKKEKPKIICLGKLDPGKPNLLGDEKTEKPISPWRAWQYLNPAIKNSIFILIGFIPAYFTVGIEYALLWFTITGSRNMFVDLVSGNGLKPTEWNISDINWTNFAHSLFWTGFSVPILGFVKVNFDQVWTGPHEGAMFEITKFFCLNISNGIYLATHNFIRGFDKVTTRANFFRSLIAWPLAAAFSPAGNAMMVPSIVQAKFWSDFVAAIIEGTGKYNNIIRLKDQIMKKLLPDLVSEDEETEKLAMLDMIYFMDESTRAAIALKKQLFTPAQAKKSLLKRVFRRHSILEPNDYYFELKERIEDPQRYNQLLDYIIANYRREQSLFLVNMLSTNYNDLKKWFGRLNK